MVEFVYPTKSSNRRAVGQAYRQSESSQRAHPADDPRQNKHSDPKKPDKVSCEETHKFLQFINTLFFITVTQKSEKPVLQVASNAGQRISKYLGTGMTRHKYNNNKKKSVVQIEQ